MICTKHQCIDYLWIVCHWMAGNIFL